MLGLSVTFFWLNKIEAGGAQILHTPYILLLTLIINKWRLVTYKNCNCTVFGRIQASPQEMWPFSPCFLLQTQVSEWGLVKKNPPFWIAMLLIQHNVAMVMADLTQGLWSAKLQSSIMGTHQSPETGSEKQLLESDKTPLHVRCGQMWITEQNICYFY